MTDTTSSTLLGEINDYNEAKEELYNKIKIDEINKDLNQQSTDIENIIVDVNNNNRFDIFSEFFNKEYGNNILIGDYFNTKIIEINDLINKAKKELENEKLKTKEIQIKNRTFKTFLENEYNRVVINKIYRHILLIIICVLVIMNLLCILKSYGFIDNYISVILNILLVIITALYIMSILYSKYPRKSNEFHRFNFPLDNENMDASNIDYNTEPTVNITDTVNDIIDEQQQL